MKFIKYTAAMALTSLLTLPAFACYTVYDSSNRVVWQGDESPVDMSKPLHETVPARFPGGSMVFDQDARCASFSNSQRPGPTRTQSVLLTDQRTARALNVPYTALPSNIAMVQAGAVRMEPGVMTIPSVVMAGTTPSTATMGGPPARAMAPRGTQRY